MISRIFSDMESFSHQTENTQQEPREVATLTLKVTGDPLDPDSATSFIKPGELVHAVEITPLNRSELVLYNQLLAHAWNDIAPGKIYSVAKARLRGSHESNDRLHDAFDRLMGAFAKIKYKDPASGHAKTVRISLLGPNAEEEGDQGRFHYTLDPMLLKVLQTSRTWARLRSEILYLLRSKYSIRLYEAIEQRINMRRQHEAFTIDGLRELLGVPKDKLTRFADLNSQCLKPALAEVNQLTDYEVAVALKKRGRRVETITLTWLKKCPESRIAAAKERAQSRIGRAARRKATVEVIT